MAEITRAPFLRHLRSDASSHILHFKRSRIVRSGRGLAFWFLPLSSSIAEVPVDDRELPFLFHGRTADYQDVSAQGVITFRVADPVVSASRVDFTLDLETGAHLRQPLERMALQLTTLAQQQASHYIGTTPLKVLLIEGPVELRDRITQGLAADPTLPDIGLAVVSVRISSVKPRPELEKALEAPMRERIQQSADEAAFERRALAVEKERAIRENELKNQIELARREEELILQRGQNDRRTATEQAEAQRIGAESSAATERIAFAAQAEKTRALAHADAESVRTVEGARAEIEKSRLEVLATIPPAVLAAMAARELAGKLTRIDHLSLSPDALTPMLQRLVGSGTRALESEG